MIRYYLRSKTNFLCWKEATLPFNHTAFSLRGASPCICSVCGSNPPFDASNAYVYKGLVCDTHAWSDAWICTYALSLNSLQLVKSNIARRFRGEIARRKEGTRGALSSGKDGLVKGDGEGLRKGPGEMRV